MGSGKYENDDKPWSLGQDVEHCTTFGPGLSLQPSCTLRIKANLKLEAIVKIVCNHCNALNLDYWIQFWQSICNTIQAYTSPWDEGWIVWPSIFKNFQQFKKNEGQALLWLLFQGSTIAIITPTRTCGWVLAPGPTPSASQMFMFRDKILSARDPPWRNPRREKIIESTAI